MKNSYTLRKRYNNNTPSDIYYLLEQLAREETLPAENIAEETGTYTITIEWKADE